MDGYNLADRRRSAIYCLFADRQKIKIKQESLNLKAAGVEIGKRGEVAVKDYLQPNIHAAS